MKRIHRKRADVGPELLDNVWVKMRGRGCVSPHIYSLVRLTLIPEGSGTRLVIEKDAYPEGKSPLFPTWHEHLSVGWEKFYLEAFAKYPGTAK